MASSVSPMFFLAGQIKDKPGNLRLKQHCLQTELTNTRMEAEGSRVGLRCREVLHLA